MKIFKKNIDKNKKDTILFWVPGGMTLMLQIEAVLARALMNRGVNVHAIICDGTYKACIRRQIQDNISTDNWKDVCFNCIKSNSAILDSMQIPYSYIGKYVSHSHIYILKNFSKEEDWYSIKNMTFNGITIGKNALSSAVRYLQGLYDPNENMNKEYREIIIEYAFSALVCTLAASISIKLFSPYCVFMSHGVFVDWGPALSVARRNNIKVTAWCACHLPLHFFFAQNEDLLRNSFTNITKNAWNNIKKNTLTIEQNQRLDEYIKNRYFSNTNFDIKQPITYIGNKDLFLEKYGLKKNKPIWAIITHLNWDAGFDSSPQTYSSPEEWTLRTIEKAIHITDVQWVLKIHPAEKWHDSVGGVLSLIKKYFPSLPNHIKVITAEEKISPLDFIEFVYGGVTIVSTVGLELAIIGKPVILAGEAHYGMKGFTHDCLTHDNYCKLLKNVKSIPPLNKKQLHLARRYAYCYFIERQIPFPVIEQSKSGWWKYRKKKDRLLIPGKDPFIDFICDRIIDGKDFIMDEKLVKLSLDK